LFKSTNFIPVAVREVLNVLARLLMLFSEGRAVSAKGRNRKVGISNSEAKILASTSVGLPL
jgi:hypothetical protein